MKKSRLLGAICASLAFVFTNVSASDKYWVCGDDSWEAASCWSSTDGGSGGAGIPTANDIVYLTQSDAIVTYSTLTDPMIGDLRIGSTGGGEQTYCKPKAC